MEDYTGLGDLRMTSLHAETVTEDLAHADAARERLVTLIGGDTDAVSGRYVREQTVSVTNGDILDFLNSLRRLRTLAVSAVRAETKATGDLVHERKTSGALTVENNRIKRETAERVATAEALAVEAGVTDEQVTARVEADRAHHAHLERCHAAEVDHLRASVAKLQKEARDGR